MAWEQVRSISVGEVIYCANDSIKKEPALRIAFDDTVDISHCGDMLAIQAGTESYFAARARQKYTGVSWKEPSEGRSNENIILIGEQHFHGDIQHVCRRLQAMLPT